MEYNEAIRYLLLTRKPSLRVSDRYGQTNLLRSTTAWRVAMQLASDDTSQVDKDLLDEIMVAVENGDNVVDAFLGED